MTPRAINMAPTVNSNALPSASGTRPRANTTKPAKVFGSRYRQALEEVKSVLSNLKKEFPELGGQGYEIAGFFRHQG